MRNKVLLILCSMLILGSCIKKELPDLKLPDPLAPFNKVPVAITLSPGIDETSGMADSKINKGYLWVHEDSGNPTQMYLLGHNAKIAKTVYLKGIINRDWEDMALAGNNIYLADIGDNNLAYTSYNIYQFPEPAPATDTVKSFTTIRFQYPDGSHDAEALLVDPKSKDMYIITKQDNPSRIYKLTFPYAATTINTATLIGELSYKGVVSAALSPDNKEIIIKTYPNLHLYYRPAGVSIAQALLQKSTSISYTVEPQGEAITFANDNAGFFTLSEKRTANAVNLYFYKRRQ